MMGYLMPQGGNAQDLALYRSYQCGLCAVLQAEFGLVYRLFAKPDLVFYNIWLDLFSETTAAMGKSPCPLSLGLHQRDARVATENTRLAAAFGVYMAVEKLRDDWEDERSVTKGLAWRALRPGQEKARSILGDAGFPLAEMDQWMRQQAAIEQRSAAELTEAAQPTQEIAALSFAFAGRASPARQATAGAIGRAIGAFLYWVDNRLDMAKDMSEGAYNPLLRSLSQGTILSAEKARAEAERGAAEAVALLATLVPGLGRGELGHYLEQTLVVGFGDKLRRLRALPTDVVADVRALMPPVPPVAERLRGIFAPAVQKVAFQLSMVLMMLFPKATWAQGLASRLWGATVEQGESSWDKMLNSCFCSNMCADGVSGCGDSCGDSCGASCGDGCSNACS
jgi:Family of unknown function (DUF5685)